MKHKAQMKVAGLTLVCFIVGCGALGYVTAQYRYFATSQALEVLDADKQGLDAYPLVTRDRKSNRISTAEIALASDTLQPTDLAAQAHSLDRTLTPAESIANPPLPRPRPKSLQKTYTLLSDGQIGAIRARLRLTADQQGVWSPVEASLRNLATRLHEIKSSGGTLTDLPLDSREVTELQTAAKPFIAQLRPNQKQELKMLAHLVGLGKVVAEL